MVDQHIVVVGGIARRHITEADEVPGLGETIETTKPFESHTGGRGAFTAVAVHRLSHIKPSGGSHLGVEPIFENMTIRVYLVATVGDDKVGEGLIERMTECGVNAENVETVSDASSDRVVVVVDPATKDHRTWFDATANHRMEPHLFRKPDSLNGFAGGTKPVLLITNLELKEKTTEQLINAAERDNVQILLHLVPSRRVSRPLLKKVMHLVIHKAEARRSNDDCPTDDDPPEAWAVLAQEFLDIGARNVVITLGAQGAYYANNFGVHGFVPGDGPEDIGNKVGGT